LDTPSGAPGAWDDNGNLLNDGTHTYSYDFANRLTGLTQGTNSFAFNYDGLDNRYRQTVNGQTTTDTLDLACGLSQVLYDGTYSYSYGLGRISQQKNGVTETFLPDGLGSVRQLADQNGSVIFGQAFDPFGNSIGQSGLGGSSYGYAGEWTDGSGLQNLRARYYSPVQGRFLSKDSFSGFLNQPSTLNVYAYATNNPVLMRDPTGHFAWLPVFVIAGAVIGAAVNYGSQVYNNYQSNKCDLGAAFTQNINFSAVMESAIAGSAMGLSAAILGPAALAVAGDALAGVGLATGSTAVFGAGISATEASIGLGAAIYSASSVTSQSSPVINGGDPEENYPPGSFSIIDWTGYPEGPAPKPTVPFSLLTGDEYKNARLAANGALHDLNPDIDFEVHEIQPVKFGGSPTDLSNKFLLPPDTHKEYTSWWKALQRDLER
jgi:RHS repeat-associated protein